MAGLEDLDASGLSTGDTWASEPNATPIDKQLVKAALFPSRANPAKIGRYTVLGLLGRGGMGVVYACYDDLLDRKIAVKVLHGERTPTAKARLMREAQALARLNHPNVVTIHDVGLVGAQVYLAMEFVDGQTLGAWRRAARRTWREILAVVIAAGEGLAAAHAKGLVHRDVKPDNIMVGADGRVRVMDFGLAHSGEGAVVVRPELDGVSRGHDALSTELTRTDAVIGTPAYMSPEQLLGGSTDARTDQFCLCLTAWEALYGQRAFTGEPFSELARRVIRGTLTPPPAGAEIPAWLRRVLERGLRSGAGERFPDTPALLAALRADPTRRQRMVAGATALAVALVGGFGARHYAIAQQEAGCAAEGASVAAVWNEDAAARLREGLIATGVPYAATTAEKVIPYFAAQAEAWQAARTEACLDARVRETLRPELFEQAAWCLDERRMELEALVAELSRATANSVVKAVPAAAGLSSLAPCRDASRLARLPALPHDRRGVQAVRGQLSRAEALQAAGSYDDGLTAARVALTAAESLGWPPLVVAARLRVGHLLGLSGKIAEADATLEDAYFQASEIGALEVAATASTLLVYMVGYKESRHAEGRRWWRQAEVLLKQIGAGEGDPLPVLALSNLALVYDSMGAYEDAVALNERALASRERALGADHPTVADSLHNLGTVLDRMGRYEEALHYHERSLAIRERAYGPLHPVVASSLNNLGAVQFSLGAYAQAKALFERALEVAERSLGPDHPTVADYTTNVANADYMMGALAAAKPRYERSLAILEKLHGPDHPSLGDPLNNYANLLDMTGERAAARAMYERALAIRERAFGPDHPVVADSLSSLAAGYTAAGEYAEARALNERALAIRERALGPEHAAVAESLHNLAGIELITGETAKARALYERALAIHEKAGGPEHPDVAYHLTALAEVALAERRPAEAIPLAERAIKIRSRGEIRGGLLAQSNFRLAQALWAAPTDQGGDQGRALALARECREALREATDEALRAEVDAFLASHAGAAPR
jgi:tetratricopeptide (TPR) repeat protein/predicted Ser/Thr protein kinase